MPAPPPGKVIITCAVTGSIHTPSMSAALPITANEIVASALGAAEAGAAILHLHAHDPDRAAAPINGRRHSRRSSAASSRVPTPS